MAPSSKYRKYTHSILLTLFSESAQTIAGKGSVVGRFPYAAFSHGREVSLCVSLCMSLYVSLSLSLCLSVCLSVCTSLCICVSLRVSVSALGLSKSVLSVSVFLCLCLFLSVFLCLSVCLSLLSLNCFLRQKNELERALQMQREAEERLMEAARRESAAEAATRDARAMQAEVSSD